MVLPLVGLLGACTASTAPPLVASGGVLTAGESTPYIPPCNTSVDASDQTGAFIDAAVDAGVLGTQNPTTPSDAGVPDAVVVSPSPGVDARPPCT